MRLQPREFAEDCGERFYAVDAARDHEDGVVSGERAENVRMPHRVEVETDRRKRSISGSLMAGDRPRIVEIEGVSIETSVTPNMLFVRNNDKPGFIGNLGRTLGDANINIASFDLGRRDAGDEAICVVSVDQRIDEGLLKRIVELPNVVQARVLAF